jgi:hypothetical protein
MIPSSRTWNERVSFSKSPKFAETQADQSEEMQKAALRTAVPLYKMSNQGQAPEFHSFVNKQLGMEKWKDFKQYKV